MEIDDPITGSIALCTTELEDVSALLGCHKAPDLFSQTLGCGLERDRRGGGFERIALQGI